MENNDKGISIVSLVPTSASLTMALPFYLQIVSNFSEIHRKFKKSYC